MNYRLNHIYMSLTSAYSQKKRRECSSGCDKRPLPVLIFRGLSLLNFKRGRLKQHLKSGGPKIKLQLFVVTIFITTFIFRPSLLHAQNYSTTIHKTVQFSQVNNPKNEL